MSRKIARIVTAGAVSAIPKSDRLELVKVGGWPVVCTKGLFTEGTPGVFFEIDCFLPRGNPSWEHIMQEEHLKEVNGAIGRVLKSVTLRGQPSQGLLLPLTILPPELQNAPVGTDVSEALGVFKYEEPLPSSLLALAVGYRPGLVPSTSQERIQNIEPELLAEWVAKGVEWEVTEKCEGEATSFAIIENKFCAMSSEVSFKDTPEVIRWALAHEVSLPSTLSALYPSLVIQGELIGPGMEGNTYNLSEHQLVVFNLIDQVTRQALDWDTAQQVLEKLRLKAVPLVDKAYVLPPDATIDSIAAMADGPSALNPRRRREGLVFTNRKLGVSFKAISVKYLLNEKLS